MFASASLSTFTTVPDLTLTNCTNVSQMFYYGGNNIETVGNIFIPAVTSNTYVK